MFDIGFSELLLLAVVALLVLGPQRLPRAARMAGLWVRRAKSSWYSVKAELERELADEELKRSLKASSEDMRSIQKEIEASVTPGNIDGTPAPAPRTTPEAGTPGLEAPTAPDPQVGGSPAKDASDTP